MTLALAASLAQRCVSIAGGTVILHGSLATGGYRPGSSDIDLLQVTDGPVDVAAYRSLAASAPLDLHVVSTAVAAAPTVAPPIRLYAGHGDLSVEVAADPDLVTELSIARAHGVTLAGTAALGPVPDSWVVDRGRYWITRWLALTDDEPHAAFMVLTACRMWRFAVEGVHSPKPAAGRWALTRDPSLSAIPAALSGRPIPPAAITDVLTAALGAPPFQHG
jgi:aminoglycoside adenylyltransferase-like protein/nucleotidyltransferase-like protein